MTGKKILILLALTLFAYMFSFTVVGAESTINDLDTQNYAYNSVVKLIKDGVMTLDSKGSFYPAQFVNKFEFSKIVAQLLGYKEIDFANIQAGNQAVINLNSKFSGLITLYEKKFNVWDKTSSMQVAYLLDKGILKELDLAQFVIEYGTGEQVVKNISKQEISTWLVRILGKEEIANTYVTNYKFTDDSLIDNKYKAHVYYLYSLGLFKGDDKGNFNPKSSIRKDTLAVLLDRTISYKQTGTITQATIPSTTQQTTATTTNTTTIKPIAVDKKVKLYSGEFEVLYEGNYALKLKQKDGISRISTIDKTVEVIKQNQKIKLEDLKAGNLMICVERASNIVSIYITSMDFVNDVHANVKQNLISQGYEITEDNVVTGTVKQPTTTQNAIITSGKIVQILISDVNKVTIQNDNGEKTTYTLKSNCQISSKGVSYTIYDLRLGQTASFTANNLEASKLELSSSTTEYSIRARIDYVNKDESYIKITNLADNTIIDKVYIDKNTAIYDPDAGEILTINDMENGKGAYIVINEQSITKKVAKSLTLLKD